MVMGVAFRQMQPKSKRHQRARHYQLKGYRLIQEGHGDDRANEGREREICACAGCAEVSQG
jgi:hypothetical protein